MSLGSGSGNPSRGRILFRLFRFRYLSHIKYPPKNRVRIIAADKNRMRRRIRQARAVVLGEDELVVGGFVNLDGRVGNVMLNNLVGVVIVIAFSFSAIV